MDELDLELDSIIDDYLKEESKATVVEKQKNSKKSIWACTEEVKFNENKTYDRLEIVDPDLLESLTERYDVSEDVMYGINYESNLYNESSFNRVMTSRVTLFSMKNKFTDTIKYELSIQDEVHNKKYQIKGFEKLDVIDDLVVNIDNEKYDVITEYVDYIENNKYVIYREKYNNQLEIAKVCPSLYKIVKKAEPLCTKDIWTFGMPEDMKNEIVNIEKNEMQKENEYFEDYLLFYQKENAWKNLNQIKEDTWNKTEILDYSNKIVEEFSIEDKEFLRNVANIYNVKLAGMYRYFGDNKKELSRIKLLSICDNVSSNIEYKIVLVDDKGERHSIYGLNERNNSYLKKIELLNENVEFENSHILKEIETSVGNRYVIHRNSNGLLGIAQVEFNQNKAEFRNLFTQNTTSKDAVLNQKYQQLRYEEKKNFDKVDQPILLGVIENVYNLIRDCVGLESKQLRLPEKTVENKSLALVQYKEPSKIKIFFKYVFKVLLNKSGEYEQDKF